jgi:large subunit ribosomal protein L13
MQTTRSFNTESADRKWYVVDAENKILGRLACELARRLRGKHKPEYTAHSDQGDFIIVINAKKVKVSGNKFKDKLYRRHTGFQGGLKTTTFEKMMQHKPIFIIEKAVRGMLPKGPLGRQLFKKLKVYADAAHEHAAQQPQLLDLHEAE